MGRKPEDVAVRGPELHTPPRIAVFGASGRTGRELVAQALTRGYAVRALVREGRSLAERRGAVQVIVGSPLWADDVAATVERADAVVVLLGAREPSRDVFCAQATERIVEAMQEHGVGRLLCVTGAMVGEASGHRSFALERMARAARKRMPDVMADRARQEEVVRASGLEWTLVKPPRLADGARTRSFRAATDLVVGVLSSVRRSDLAAFLLDEIVAPRFVAQAVVVG